MIHHPELADRGVLKALLEFAVHDLGAGGVGALIVLRSDPIEGPIGEELLPIPPPLRIGTPFDLAPLRHALGQVDGAAVFDQSGTLRQLGVRLIPSLDAEDRVDPLGGTRHTSARRYSFDDPSALVVVSEDGPVTILRKGTGHGPIARSPLAASRLDGVGRDAPDASVLKRVRRKRA
jgi:DNA integrity scanning protein DisA with diadenylate cyclase activity